MLDRGKSFVPMLRNLKFDFFFNFLSLLLSDGDGRISWEELGYVMKTLGHKVSEQHLKEIMRLIDDNGNGVIDFDEFTDMLDKTKSIADPEADLKEAFRVFDLDGDGVITVNFSYFFLLFPPLNSITSILISVKKTFFGSALASFLSFYSTQLTK